MALEGGRRHEINGRVLKVAESNSMSSAANGGARWATHGRLVCKLQFSLLLHEATGGLEARQQSLLVLLPVIGAEMREASVWSRDRACSTVASSPAWMRSVFRTHGECGRSELTLCIDRFFKIAFIIRFDLSLGCGGEEDIKYINRFVSLYRREH